MIGVERMTQAERVGEHRRAQKDRVVAERRQSPKPGRDIRADQQNIYTDDPRAQADRFVAEKIGQTVRHFFPLADPAECLKLDFRMGVSVPVRRAAMRVPRCVD